MQHADKPYPVTKSDDEWRRQLTAAEFQVLRQAGTERPFSSPYEDDPTVAVYACRACGAELFHSTTKFDAHCGWPAFYAPLARDNVEYLRDISHGMDRVEVRCSTCGSHLGHLFTDEGYSNPTNERYCINGIALTQRPATPRSSGQPAGDA